MLYYLGLRQATLAVAEICTGGLIAQRITSFPGSSRSFLGGAVVYSDELKTSFAGVPPDLIEKHGAVSEEVAQALAEGIRARTGATMGSVLPESPAPLAAPSQSPSAWSTSPSAMHRAPTRSTAPFAARERVREWAAQQALDLVRRRLM